MVGNDSFSDEQCSKAGAGDKPDGQRVEDSGAVRYGSGVLRHGVTALCGSAKAATQRGILMLLSLLLVVTLVPLGLGSQAGAEVWDTSTTAWVATGNYLDVPLDLKDQEISVTTIIPQGEDSMGLSTEACWDIYLNGSRVDGVAKADSYRLWPKGSDLASHVPTLDIVCSEQIVYLARTRGYTFHFSKTISGTAEGLNPQGPGSINYSVTYSGKATVKLNLNWVLKPDMLGAYSGSVLGPTGDNHNETFHQTNGGGDPDVYRYWQLTYTGYTVTYSDVQIAKTPSHLGETVGNNLRFPIYHSVTNQSFGSAAPVFTAHPNILKKVGQPIPGHSWTEGVTARWGHTASKTFGDGSTANGTITSTNTAFLGTALPNNGAAFTGIGKAQQSLRARDNSQNLPFTTDAQNPRESTTTRWITVTTDAAPTLTLSYAPDSILAGQPYAGEWTNQDVKAEVSSNLYGSFRTLLKEGAGEAAKGSSDAAAVAKTYNADTPAAGTSVSGVLVATADNTVLSAQTAARTIRVDKTNPVPGVNYRPDLPLDEAFTDTSSDALSGIQATRIAVVAKGTAKPAAGSDAWINDFAEVTVAEPGYYDIWVEAKDRAGNVAALMPLGESTLIKSRLAPSITGELADDTAPGEFVSHATDTWTNKDVRVTVSEASPEAIAGDHYFGLYRSTASVPLWLAVGYDNHVPVDYSFRAETAGINLFGVAQDGPSPIAATNFTPQSSELSERAFYTVKIDKTKPYALATYSFSTDSFTDASTDSGLVQSGVDATKTRVAVVESGSEPVEGDYVVLAAASRGTDPEKFYDAWVICYDNAGNASAAAKVFGDVSGTGKDTIEAKDFEYGLNQGELADAKAIALALVEGVYAGAGMSEATSESGGAIDPANFIVDTGELAAINDAVTSGNKGRFPLTFFTPLANPNFPGQDTQQAVTVYVTLKDQGADSYGGGPGGEGPGPGGEGGPGGPGGSGQGSQAGERIYADNFLWATDDGELSAQAAIQAAFVSLYDADGARLSDLSGVQVDSSQLAEINAAIINKDFSHTWPLTFTGPDGTLVTVEVTLFEKVASPTPPDPDVPAPPAPDHRSLGASSFALTWEARASLDADAARLLSGAKAYDSYGNPVAPSSIAVDPSATELDAIHSAPAPGPDGYRIYPLTFAYDGKAVTVSVRLFDNGPAPPGPSEEALWANDFSYGCSSGELTAALARQLSGVWGIQKSGYPFARTQITPDAAQLAAIEVARAVHTLGSYPLVFRAGDAAEVAITVTLRDNGPVPPAPGRDTLTANDFLYGLDEPALTEAIIRSLSFVQGMDEDGNHLPDAAIVADAERLAALLAHFEAGRWGVFEMRYTTANGGEVDFKVTLQQHGSLPPAPPGTDQITANDFSYGVGEAALSAEIAKFLAHVVCRDANGVPVDVGLIAVDAGQLAAIQAAQVAGTIGDFPLRFTSPDANSVTVSVSLTNEGGPTVMPGITPGTGTPHIAANDFALGADEPPLFAAVARALSKVSATDKDGFPIACGQIAVNDAELAAIRAAQAARTVTTLPLSFSLASGEWISVAVRLYHHGAGSVDTSDPDRPRQTSAHLNGNDFTYGCSEPDLTRETAAWLSRVTARDASGNPIDPRQLGVSDAELAVIVSAQHSKTLGTYPLTFTAADGSSLTIYVTLHHVGAGGITAGSDTSHLTANNFTYNVAQSLLDARIVLSHSSPVAIDRNGVPAANATISVHAADISALIAAQRDLRAETNYDGRSADYFVRLIHDGQALRITVTLIKDADQRPSMPSQPAAVSEDKGSYSVRYFAGGIDVTGMPEDVFDLSDGDLHTIAAAPKRRGYAFAGWRGSDEKTYRPADSYTIDGSSLALTAIWKSGSTTWLANYGSPDPDSSPFDADNFAEAVTEQNIPVFGVPLYGPKGFAVWSLANLLMLLSGLVIAAIFVFRLLRCRQGHGAQHVQSSAAQRRPLLFMGGGAALACINVLIFALTQNLSLPMAWFDAWSAVMAVVMVLETVVLLVGNCGMKDSTDDRITSPYRE